MGLLVIRGLLRAKQFWPTGGADADTATVEVKLTGARPFVYVDDRGTRRTTRAFDNAEVIGRSGRRPVVQFKPRQNANVINVRLQGIDAPELHYMPQVAGSAGKNGKFRQNLGETCAHALRTYLKDLDLDEAPCEVVTRVSKPDDVCDTFGRVVGNVVLTLDGAQVDLNHWLLREGWALPGLYNSMTAAEIRQALADHAAAREGERGLFSGGYVTGRLARFDPNRRYRKGTASFRPFRDKGPVNFPKFFRRQAEYQVRRAVGEDTPARFLNFVAGKKDDLAIATTRFLNHSGSTTSQAFKRQFAQLATFIAPGNYPLGPEIIFWEADSKLVRAGTNTPIKNW